MNEGKAFEQDVRQSCINDEIFCLRLNDSSSSYIKEANARFTPQNKADFILFNRPNLFAIECKSTKYKSISFQREDGDSGMIALHQIKGLVDIGGYDGAYAGFLFNFRDETLRSNSITYWMDIKDFSNFYTNTDKMSINKLDIVNNGGIVVSGKLKRVHFIYDMKKLIKDIRGKEEDDGLGI